MTKLQIIVPLLVGFSILLSACSTPAAEPALEPTATLTAPTAVAGEIPVEAVVEAVAEAVPLVTVQPVAEATAEPVEAAASAPVVLRQGDFRDRDAQHQGSGIATLVQDGDEHLLRLTNFASSDGPDLFVWLVENPNTLDAGALGASLDLGLLQSLTGDQEYVIPAETDLTPYQGVIIYCREFHFVFSTAPFSN